MPRSTDARRQGAGARTDKALQKYLDRHAEPETASARKLARIHEPWTAVLVIPAYGEDSSLFRTLASTPPVASGRALVVIVLNERADAPDWARQANTRVRARLESDCKQTIDDGVRFGSARDHDLVILDRTGRRALPPRQGVGLARKIGADFALALWAAGGCARPWIYCTDADAVLPADYFDRPLEPGAAQLFDFRHEVEDADPAILEYEIYLRYGVLGLHAAGSPWAWHAIGSTLAIDMLAYARVRGFPRREAAEDFHLLAKLAKVGELRPSRGAAIRLSGRTSTRVPFGTGHAMLRAHDHPRLATDPRNYGWLGIWLEALDRVAANPARRIAACLVDAARDHQRDPAPLTAALASIGAIESAEKLVRNRRDLRRTLNENFDALATLRLLHALRDQVHPDVPIAAALAHAPFLEREVARAAGDPGAVREALLNQERRSLH